jgi:hypothetical protein
LKINAPTVVQSFAHYFGSPKKDALLAQICANAGSLPIPKFTRDACYFSLPARLPARFPSQSRHFSTGALRHPTNPTTAALHPTFQGVLGN